MNIFKDDINYIDENTRVKYGWHFAEGDYSYQLQRKIGKRWKKKAWTYNSSKDTYEILLEYLFWYEGVHKWK